MSFWKNLKSKITEKSPEPNNDPNVRPVRPIGPIPSHSGQAPEPNKHAHRPKASPSPGEGGRGEGELNDSGPQSAQSSASTFQPFNDSTPFESDNRNGKIARLPRPLRERINQAIYHRFTANDLARELNKMPEVKAVLAAHFEGRPILQQNISEWKRGGYRDWLSRRQILEQQSELTADAKDMAETANGMADSLFGILTLDYARLMMNRDGDEEAFEKKRKALSLLAQDVVRLRRCHLQARRVEIQETKLENETEKTDEQLLLKFTEWTENPEVRKTLILAPMERDRRLRILNDMPPAPEDPLVQRETQGDPWFGDFDEIQSKNKPIQTEKSNERPAVPPVSDPKSEPAPASEKAFESDGHSNRANASPSPGGRGRGEGKSDNSTEPVTSQTNNGPNISPINPIPSHPYESKTTQEIIAEAEDNFAGEKAKRLNRRRQNETGEAPIRLSEPQQAPKREMSPYDKALLEGKTFIEALYAQGAPVPKPKDETQHSKPSIWGEGVCEPVHYAPRPYG